MRRLLAIIAALIAGTACAVAMGQGTYCGPDGCYQQLPQSLPLAPVHREQPAKIHADLWAATARIKCDDGSMGSGVLVAVNDAGGWVLTNNHVVKDARSPSGVAVSFPGGFSSGGRVERVDATWDLAAIHIAKPPAKPVTLATTNIPVRGELLAIAGFGDPSSRGRAVAGRCTGYFAPRQGMQGDWFEVNAVARSGDSGGPVFNEQGQLAGVLWGSDFQTGTQGVCCGRIRAFLRGLIGLPPKQQKPNVPVAPAGPLPNNEVAIGEPSAPPLAPPGAENGGTSQAPLFQPDAPAPGTKPPEVSGGPPPIPQPLDKAIDGVGDLLAHKGGALVTSALLALGGPTGWAAAAGTLGTVAFGYLWRRAKAKGAADVKDLAGKMLAQAAGQSSLPISGGQLPASGSAVVNAVKQAAIQAMSIAGVSQPGGGVSVSATVTPEQYGPTYNLSSAYADDLGAKRANQGMTLGQQGLLAQIQQEAILKLKNGEFKNEANIAQAMEHWIMSAFLSKHGVRTSLDNPLFTLPGQAA